MSFLWNFIKELRFTIIIHGFYIHKWGVVVQLTLHLATDKVCHFGNKNFWRKTSTFVRVVVLDLTVRCWWCWWCWWCRGIKHLRGTCCVQDQVERMFFQTEIIAVVQYEFLHVYRTITAAKRGPGSWVLSFGVLWVSFKWHNKIYRYFNKQLIVINWIDVPLHSVWKTTQTLPHDIYGQRRYVLSANILFLYPQTA